MLLTLIRQLVELRYHLERAAPLSKAARRGALWGGDCLCEGGSNAELAARGAARRCSPPRPAEAGRLRPLLPGEGIHPSGAASRPSTPPPAGPEGGGGGRARTGPSRAAPARARRRSAGGAARLICPCPGPLPARAAPPPPPRLAPGARFASLAAAAGTAGCLFRVGKGGKVGRGPGRLKRGWQASPVGLAQGEAPGSWPSSLGVLLVKFSAPQAHVSPTFPFLPFSGELEGGPGRRAWTASAPSLSAPDSRGAPRQLGPLLPIAWSLERP